MKTLHSASYISLPDLVMPLRIHCWAFSDGVNIS